MTNSPNHVITVIVCAAALSGDVSSVCAQPAVAADVVIRLERTSCFGECPVYTVTVNGEGEVTYDGVRAVRVRGIQTRRVPLARVSSLLDMAERIGFFDLADKYPVPDRDGTVPVIDDLSTVFVSITRDGRSKRIEDLVGAPERLKELERQIDDVAGTRRWIRVDTPTLQQLVRDGAVTVNERAALLRQALEHDELDVVKGLIDIGTDPNGAYFGTNTPALMLVQPVSAAKLLLAAGANPNYKNDNGGTPLSWSTNLTADVAEALLNAGARVDEPVDASGGTALWHAACRGNVGVVSLLLRHGANAVALGALGTSAIDCARQERDRRRFAGPTLFVSKPPFSEDFDGVISLLEQALAKRPRAR